MSVAKPVEAADEELLAEFCTRGSTTAFGRLVERHLPMVRAVAAQVLADRHEAEDVAQAVFILLARKAPALRNPGALSSWLFRTAEFTARRTRRKLATRAGYEREAAVALEDGKTADRDVPPEWPELRVRLDQAIAALPAAVVAHRKKKAEEAAAKAKAKAGAEKKTASSTTQPSS